MDDPARLPRRTTEETVGEVLTAKHGGGDPAARHRSRPTRSVRDAVALFHEHRVSQLPVVSTHDRASIVGSVGERGLLKHAIGDAAVLDAEVADVMEPPFPAVAVDDSVREAVELLSGRARRADRHRARRARRHRHALGPARVARAMKFETRAVHAGLEPDPSYGGVVPAIHQASTYVQSAPGEFVGDYDYSRAANPTRSALESALGTSRAGTASAFELRHGRDPRAADRALLGGRPRRHARRPVRRDLPARRQDPHPLGPRLHDGRPEDLDAVAAAITEKTKLDLGRDADQPDAQGRRHRGDRQARRAPSSPSTTPSPRRSTSARSSSAPAPSSTPRRSTSAGTPTRSAVR